MIMINTNSGIDICEGLHVLYTNLFGDGKFCESVSKYKIKFYPTFAHANNSQKFILQIQKYLIRNILL